MHRKSGKVIFVNQRNQKGELVSILAIAGLLIITFGLIFGTGAINTVKKFLGRAAGPQLPYTKKILPNSSQIGSIGNLTLTAVVRDSTDPTRFDIAGSFDRSATYNQPGYWFEVQAMGEPQGSQGLSPNPFLANPRGLNPTSLIRRENFSGDSQIHYTFTGHLQTTADWTCDKDNKVVLILSAYNLGSHGGFHSSNHPFGFEQVPYGQETPVDILINLKDYCGPTETAIPTEGPNPTERPISPTVTPACVEAPEFGMVGPGTIICPTKTPTPTPGDGILCTQDVRQCPDGSYVGRVPPKCEFAPCPPQVTVPASVTPQACIFQTENFVKERRKISQTDYQYLPLTAFDNNTKYGSANDRYRINTGNQTAPRPGSQFENGKYEIDAERFFPNRDRYIEGDTACVKPYYDTTKYRVAEKQCEKRDGTIECPDNLNPPPQDQRLVDRTSSAGVSIGPDEACNLKVGCGAKYSYGWVMEGKCSFNANAYIFDQQCNPIKDPDFNQRPPPGTDPKNFIADVGVANNKWMEWVTPGRAYGNQGVIINNGPRPGSVFKGGQYIITTPNLISKYNQALGHYYCCVFDSNDPVFSYILGDHPDQVGQKDYGDLASITLFLGNRYPASDPRNLWNQWEVVRQECAGWGCPGQLNPTQRKSTEGGAQDTVNGIRISCGINVKYGWMLKRKNEPLNPSPQQCLKFPVPSPTIPPPPPIITPDTPTPTPIIIIDDFCQTNADCRDNTRYCKKEPGACGERGICAKKAELCTQVYNPVCGCDQKTYSNSCVAAQSGINVSRPGACEGPTSTPTPIPTTPPSPTPTTPAGGVTLDLKLRFQGITSDQIKNGNLTVNKMNVRVGVGDGGLSAPVFKMAEFTAGDNAVWTGRVTFDNVPAGGNYKILIKGPKHLQRRICDSIPKEDISGPPVRRYVCDGGKLTINAGANSFDFSNILELAGDAPLPEIEGDLLETGQDGVANSFDAIAVISVLGQADAESLAKVDFNLDGEVNGLDFDLLQRTLSVQSDEL